MSAFEKVKSFTEKHHMLEKVDGVIVGISGGADSVCLLMMLLELQKEFSFQMLAVHVHHGIRGAEADRDEAFVKSICQKYAVELQIYHFNVPEYARENGYSEEEAGRILRYKTFHETAVLMNKQNVKIAVAHNMNDSTETFIHNLCRGTGLKGLAGIAPSESGIIRPLLCLEREEIELYLQKRNISFVNDSTNKVEDYTRNKIRLQILPYFNQNINHNSMQHIYQTSLQLREAENYLEKCTDELYKNLVHQDVDGLKIQVDEFRKIDGYIQTRILRKSIYQLTGKLKDVTQQHINDIISLVEKPVGKQIALPYQIFVERGYNSIRFVNKLRYEENTDNNEMSLDISRPGTYVSLSENAVYIVEILDVEKDAINIKNLEKTLKYNEKMYTKWFDYDKINFTVQLRHRKSGDFIVIDSHGSHKKLKSFFIDQKIPRQQREKIPLIADGSNIIWIVGHRISNDYKITPNTKKILKVERKDITKDAGQYKGINQ